MNHTAWHYGIGAVAIVLAAGALLHEPKTVTAPVQFAAVSGKVNPRAWSGLADDEIAALKARIGSMPKSGVVILCGDLNCQDLASDLESAFEDAGWTSTIERPFVDDGSGFRTSSPELAFAISTATSGRLAVGTIDGWRETNRVAIAIGKKVIGK